MRFFYYNFLVIIYLSLDSRIMDGREATLGQFPWQASLTINFNSRRFFCGGSLIDELWVLTAAHCLEKEGILASNISILLGTIDRANASGAVLRHSSEYYIHGNYFRFNNDIALVKLNEIVRDTENVRAIMLGNYLDPGLNVEVSGFGRTQDGLINTKLHYTELITIRNEDCIKTSGSPAPIREVCATPVNGSTCPGDSGSPLVMQVNGIWKQFGVIIGGLIHGCQSDTSIVSRISYYRDWILDKIVPHE
ncbi:hypothetical protein RI129_004572 [Pyrocoelia pectoralis]|uniref:Peptidase S1 domain-containing protein n=1 Tax=Pyrocoelia pectoralis TaxID=417401 RepID=A0AAN7VH70_9COLE